MSARLRTMSLLSLAGLSALIAQGGWTEVAMSPSNIEIRSLRFISADTVYAVSTFNGFRRSLDSGSTWSGFGGSLPTSIPHKMFWLDGKRGFVIGTSGNFSKTTNGGQSWSSLPISGEYNGVYFVDTSYGIAVGKSGQAWRTTNGGTSWSSLSVGSTATLHGAWMIDTSTYYVCGQNGRIRKTTNGGQTWYLQIDKNPSQERFHDIHFVTPLKGFAVSDSGLVYSTNDSGMTWTRTVLMTGTAAYDVHFVDQNTGWIAASGGKVFKTTNGGTSWGLQSTGITKTLYAVHFFNAQTGASAGTAGAMVRTSGGGGSIVTAVEDVPMPAGFDVSQNYPNPFNPSTTIRYRLASFATVRLTVVDALGRVIENLVDGRQGAGEHRATFDAGSAASGVYYYRLTVNGRSEVRKMMLMK